MADDTEPLRSVLASTPLFGHLDEAARASLLSELEWFSLPGGAVLIEQGAREESLYIVTSGQLEVRVRGGDGRELVLAQIGPGETVGEMALVSGEPRSATVTALRDSELLRLTRDTFEVMVARHPSAMLHLTRTLAQRLISTSTVREAGARPRTFALVPLDGAVDSAALARHLAAALEAEGRKAACLDARAAQESTEWFNGVERRHDVVLYEADAELTYWSRLCLRQADRMVLVASAERPPPATGDHAWLGAQARAKPCDLVLVHGAGGLLPRGAAAWLARLPVALHLHVRAGDKADMARLARLLIHRAIGVVLSGGGARSFSQIGVIRAMREAALPIDLVGGVSMGAIIAAGVALEWDDDAMFERFRLEFVGRNPLNDYTLPLLALVKGRKVSAALARCFGEARIEDLWRPYFALSCNLTRAEPIIHVGGPLTRALRASVAIPGVLPPVAEAGEVLVDGGVINNLPVDVMSNLARGPVVGVDVSRDRALVTEEHDLDGPGLRWLLPGAHRAPGIVDVLIRSGTVSSDARNKLLRGQVSLLLQPPLSAIDLLDWRSFDAAVELGYRYAAETFERMDRRDLFGGGPAIEPRAGGASPAPRRAP